jgi:hypothetical protein
VRIHGRRDPQVQEKIVALLSRRLGQIRGE